MIALPVFFTLVVLGLVAAIILQWQANKSHPDPGHKGDAHKTAEEEELHKKLKPKA